MSSSKKDRQNKPGNLFHQGLVIFGIVLGILLILEITSRLLLPNFQNEKPGRFNKEYQIDPLVTEGVFLLDENTFWRLAPNKEYSVNQNGFRDTQNTLVKKPEGVYRIICIGDSVTFGVPVEINPPEKTFAKQLESMFEKHPEYGKVEVLNAGNPCYSSYQGLKQLKHRMLKFEPDLIIIQFGINDLSPAVGLTDKEQPAYNPSFSSLYNALSKSALCCVIVKVFRKYAKGIRSSNVDLVRVPPQDFRNNSLMFLALGKLNGFQCLFVRPVGFEDGKLTTPTHYQPPPKSKMVDTLTAFANYPGDPADLFYDACHLTPEGHKRLAESIFKAITEYGMVNKGGAKHSRVSQGKDSFELKIEESK